MQKVLQLALKLNNSERNMMERFAGTARFSYNWGLDLWRQRYAQNIKSDAIKLHRELNKIKKLDFPWMYEVSKCAPQEALVDLERAFINFFEGRAAYPSFKKKGKSRDAFRLTGSIKFVQSHPSKIKSSRSDRKYGKHMPKKQWYIQLPRLGKLRLHEQPKFPHCRPDELHMGMVTISRSANRWSVSVRYDIETQVQSNKDIVGIDLGLIYPIVRSDGKFISNPRILRNKEKKLRKLNKSLARKDKGSNNRIKAVKVLSKHHKHIADSRKNFIHPITTELAKNHGRIVVEDLHVKGMIRNRKLSKAIADVSWGEIRRQLEYKCKLYGSELIVADRYYPSTRLCSKCNIINPKQTLSKRVFDCLNCDNVMDRDLNAAFNLKQYSSDWRKLIRKIPESTSGTCGDARRPDMSIPLESHTGRLDETENE